MKRPIAFFLIVSLLLAGCAGQGDSPNSDTAVTFTDDLGREVTVENPRRVAALLGSFADVWILAGGTLCAAAEDAWEDFGLELPDAVNIGGAHSPSLEQLLSADPDFVLASSATASNLDFKDTLEAAGIAVAYFDVKHFDDYLRMLDICTDITGRKDLYEQNGLQIQTQIEAIKAQYAADNVPEEQRKVLLIRAAASVIKAKGSTGTILGEMLADMGCINIADSDRKLLENLSVEAVIQQQPYHIFVVTMGSNSEAAKASLETMLMENPAWSTLDAILSNRIHYMDKTMFNLKPNAKWAKSYQKLYETLIEES